MLTSWSLMTFPELSMTSTSKRTVVASSSVRLRNEMPTWRFGLSGLSGSAWHISTAIGGSDGAGIGAAVGGAGVGAAAIIAPAAATKSIIWSGRDLSRPVEHSSALLFVTDPFFFA